MKLKLAVSDIAWAQHDDPAVFSLLKQYGVSGIEVAPTKVWPNWEGATISNAEAYRKQLQDNGFTIPALQAILFGKQELNVFSSETHKALFSHLDFISSLGCALGAKVLVFGAPKNRRKGSIPESEANKQACAFFKLAGEICCRNKCVLGIEPNPTAYACDFINTVAEARTLVDAVNSPFVQLHLDAGATRLNGEDLESAIRGNSFVHYHISEPNLIPIGTGGVNHRAAFNALSDKSYSNWTSIEMRQAEPELENLETSLRVVKESME